MAFFEKIGGAITSGVGATANKAKDITDQSKLSSEINSKKKEVKEIYTSIGKLYVEGADEAKLLELKNNALELIKVIDALEEKYNDAKGLKKCEICGEVIDNASVFCAHCGGKQTTRVNKCVKCRTVLADGVAFCFNCGTKQPDLNAVASAPVVEQPAVAPVVEEPVVEEAVIEEVAVEEPAVEEAVIEEVAVEEPAVEEAVIEEVAVEEPEVSETEIEDIAVEDAVIEPVEDIVPDFVPAEEVVVEEVEEVAEAVVEEVSATIKCASCGAELDDDSAFCTECGTPVNKVEEKPEQSFIFCTNCGNKEDAGTKFCSECGTKL